MEQKVGPENENIDFIIYNEQFNSEYDSSNDNFAALVENLNTPPIALQNKTIKIGNMECHLLPDSGNCCNMSLAKEIRFNCMQAQWSEKKPLEPKSFSNDIV